MALLLIKLTLIAVVISFLSTIDLWKGEVETPKYNDVVLPKQEVERLSDLEKLELLGSGNFGDVYRVRHKQSSKVYALKVVHGFAMDQAFHEIDIMSRCKDCPHVRQCHGIFQKFYGDVSILMEYMAAGSLEVLAKNLGTFSEAMVADIAYQSFSGLRELHSKRIAHRDIKPANLLITGTGDMKVKIADFGLSKVVTAGNSSDEYVGTLAYMSPEKLLDSNGRGYEYDVFAGDVWSMGLTLMELYVGHFPYVKPGQETENMSLIYEIVFGEPPSMPENASSNFKDFIGRCLQKDWTRRGTAEQLLSHPFIASPRLNADRPR